MDNNKNMAKLDTYKILTSKLKKALKEEFYYEAIFIEYALLEDRTNSILKYAGIKPDGLKLSDKVNKLKDNPIFNNDCIKEKLPIKLLDDITDWKNKRNELVHKLADISSNDATLKSIATSGDELVKELSNKVKNVNNYFDKFDIADDGTLTKYTGTRDTHIVIPANVKIISHECFYANKKIQRVLIPSNVVTIGYKAFANVKNLKEVKILHGVENIQSLAFCNCENLKDVTLPKSITTVDESVFWNTPYFKSSPKRLTSILTKNFTIPDGVTSIKGYGCNPINAFEGYNNFTNITIPNSVNYIDEFAFENTFFIKKYPSDFVILGNGILHKYKGNDTIVTIPNEVTSIGEGAFNECINLKKIVIPDSVVYIGEGAFNGCENLESITISKNVSSLGDYIFENCFELRNLTILGGKTEVGELFGIEPEHYWLEHITAPASVLCKGYKQLYMCNTLTITFPDGTSKTLSVDDNIEKRVIDICKSKNIV